jgi:DnaJ-class molecular chaperone
MGPDLGEEDGVGSKGNSNAKGNKGNTGPRPGQREEVDCPTCNGTGQRGGQVCDLCNGTKKILAVR